MQVPAEELMHPRGSSGVERCYQAKDSSGDSMEYQTWRHPDSRRVLPSSMWFRSVWV